MKSNGSDQDSYPISQVSKPEESKPVEIVVMNPHVYGGKGVTGNSWTPWSIFGVIVAAIVVSNLVWTWGNSLYAEQELAALREKAEAARLESEKRMNEEKAKYYSEQGAADAEERRLQKEQDEQLAAAYRAQQMNLELQNQRLVETRTQKPIFVWSNRKTGESEDCNSWRSSNTIESTPEKRKYLRENCAN